MTPDEQALDRMLAEKVLKWTLYPWSDGYGIDPRYFDTTTGEWKSFPDDWHPTRDIAQAFMVANKIDGAELHLTVWDNDDAYAHFGERGDLGVSGVPPALAICLAAKAWLEGTAAIRRTDDKEREEGMEEV